MLKEDDIIELKSGHRVYVKDFPKHFLYDNTDFDFSLGSGELEIGVLNYGLDTSVFAGKYVVTKTVSDGGGQNFDGGVSKRTPRICQKDCFPKIW
jgi:hypothetical protein